MRGNTWIDMLIHLPKVCLILPLLIACAKPEITPDPDSLSLVIKSEQARQIAQKEIADVVLRQIDTDLNKTTFLFSDRAATKELDVTVPSPDAPSDRWTTDITLLSPLLGQAKPDMNLQDLRIGPGRVARAVTTQWSGCKIRGLTLYRNESENDLIWVAFCDTPQGTVTGEMVDRTGIFQPSNAPPAHPPVTATHTLNARADHTRRR